MNVTNRNLGTTLVVTAILVIGAVVLFAYRLPPRYQDGGFVPGVGGGPGDNATLISPTPTETPSPTMTTSPSPSPTAQPSPVINIYLPSSTPTPTDSPSMTPLPS